MYGMSFKRQSIKKQVNNYIASWEEAFQLGVNEVGGKGWNLSRLARYGFMVPAGKSVLALALRPYRLMLWNWVIVFLKRV